MKQYLTVTVEIEPKDGWEIVEHDDDVPELVSSSGAQDFSPTWVGQQLQDALRDATKHDDELGWRVTNIMSDVWWRGQV